MEILVAIAVEVCGGEVVTKAWDDTPPGDGCEGDVRLPEECGSSQLHEHNSNSCEHVEE